METDDASEARYVKVTVTRTESTDLYVKVPVDFNIQNLAKPEYRKVLHQIAEDTTNDLDWNLEDDLQVWGIRNVEAKEAEAYIFGDIADYVIDDKIIEP